jgi:predicted RNA-binding Zn-ribbon protein involved in translation (DUF1610 family)
MKNEAIKKSVVLNFIEVRFEVKKCPVCGEEMLHLRRCCGDNEVWRCESCNYVEKEVDEKIWYYYIWAK